MTSIHSYTTDIIYPWDNTVHNKRSFTSVSTWSASLQLCSYDHLLAELSGSSLITHNVDPTVMFVFVIYQNNLITSTVNVYFYRERVFPVMCLFILIVSVSWSYSTCKHHLPHLIKSWVCFLQFLGC